jgi:hypothetical protein
MEIFFHIFQVGCFKACSTETFFKTSFGNFILSKKGHQEQVSQIFLTSFIFQALKHCQIAECSLSIGLISHQNFFIKIFISSQFSTIVSLFAKQIIFHFFKAFFVGSVQIFQTKEFTKISVFLFSAISKIHFIQNNKSKLFSHFHFFISSKVFLSEIEIIFGENSKICFFISFKFLFAESQKISKSFL